MAKFQLRLQARQMRKKGRSVKDIAVALGVSKGSVSSWVKDIILSVEQLELLRKSSVQGAERGRLKSAFLQKQRWLESMQAAVKNGKSTIGNLTERELLIAGLALYWGEGCKKSRRIEFCNSDPKMIQFLLLWLWECFHIGSEEIMCCVGINESHYNREHIVKQYWSDISGIPLQQFRKTSFKKVRNEKVYENFNDHYGTFVVRVARPSRFYSQILGLIEGLADNARVAQR